MDKVTPHPDSPCIAVCELDAAGVELDRAVGQRLAEVGDHVDDVEAPVGAKWADRWLTI